LGGVDVFAGAVEGALYLGRFTLEGVAGADGGEGSCPEVRHRIKPHFACAGDWLRWPLKSAQPTLDAHRVFSMTYPDHSALFLSDPI
jgi:hypothetical protein